MDGMLLCCDGIMHKNKAMAWVFIRREGMMKLVTICIKVFVLLVFLVLAISNTQKVQFFYLPGQEVSLPFIFSVSFNSSLLRYFTGVNPYFFIKARVK